MESITTNNNYLASQEQLSDATNEDNPMKLFDQFSGFDTAHIRLTKMDSTIVISKASL